MWSCPHVGQLSSTALNLETAKPNQTSLLLGKILKCYSNVTLLHGSKGKSFVWQAPSVWAGVSLPPDPMPITGLLRPRVGGCLSLRHFQGDHWRNPCLWSGAPRSFLLWVGEWETGQHHQQQNRSRYTPPITNNMVLTSLCLWTVHQETGPSSEMLQ